MESMYRILSFTRWLIISMFILSNSLLLVEATILWFGLDVSGHQAQPVVEGQICFINIAST